MIPEFKFRGAPLTKGQSEAFLKLFLRYQQKVISRGSGINERIFTGDHGKKNSALSTSF